MGTKFRPCTKFRREKGLFGFRRRYDSLRERQLIDEVVRPAHELSIVLEEKSVFDLLPALVAQDDGHHMPQSPPFADLFEFA